MVLLDFLLPDGSPQRRPLRVIQGQVQWKENCFRVSRTGAPPPIWLGEVGDSHINAQHVIYAMHAGSLLVVFSWVPATPIS